MFVIILILGVIFVNGWTDAPNAITSVVCSKTLSMKKAVLLAAVCNFAGVFIGGYISSGVAENVLALSEGGNIALCSAMLSVIILAVSAWAFGIPTSESHAIIASLCGASLASGDDINVRVIIFTVSGLILSVGVGFVLGYALFRLIQNKSIKPKIMSRAQIFGAAFMAFMHGAQDGQKFLGIFIAAAGLGAMSMPLWTIVVCSGMMALGTALGGGRIIKNVGERMVELDLKQGVSADIAGGISLFLSTVLGMPVSTTHAKTAAVMGCGYVTGGIEKNAARQMLAAWMITFPACFGMGYVFTRAVSSFL